MSLKLIKWFACLPGTIQTLCIAEYELTHLSPLQLNSVTIQDILPLSVVIVVIDSAVLLVIMVTVAYPQHA